ncbi:MAG: S41 family peptidase [Proteobacteria bacterium]|nr:S41 family peptidase [Pseudomonadota bacterium]
MIREHHPFSHPAPAPRPGVASPARLSAYAAIGLALLLSGCVSQRVSGTSFEADTKLVFSKGYGDIAERYIEDVPVGDIAFDGLRGITDIDSALLVKRDGGQVQLANAAGPIGSFTAPGQRDVNGWAQLTSAALSASRAASRELSEAEPERIYEAVFDEALSGLDGFTRYSSARDADEERARRTGFGGVGIRIKMDGEKPVVMSIIEDTPAEAAGLLPEDVITHVNGFPITGRDLADIVDRLRGPIDTHVDLTVTRPSTDASLTFAIKRQRIIPPSVVARQDGDYLYVAISHFNQDTAHQLDKAITELRSAMGSRLKGLVLDMRDNPGGLLDQAVEVADMFLDSGTILSTQGRHFDSFQSYEAEQGDIVRGIPIAILVNGNTASASEVVAAALQDHDRAIIIGTTSYGKGTVQTVIRMPNEGELILTWSRIHAPSGYTLHRLGVMPAVCTSGMTEGAGQVISRVRRREAEQADLMRKWRAVSVPDKQEADALRASCPPHGEAKEVDLDVAERVLADSALYRLAVARSHAEVAKR